MLSGSQPHAALPQEAHHGSRSIRITFCCPFCSAIFDNLNRIRREFTHTEEQNLWQSAAVKDRYPRQASAWQCNVASNLWQLRQASVSTNVILY
jgi:hypothetical protein